MDFQWWIIKGFGLEGDGLWTSHEMDKFRTVHLQIHICRKILKRIFTLKYFS